MIASNKDNLSKLMLMNNTMNSTAFNYHPPMKDGRKWVVWFYADLSKHKIPKETDLKQMEALDGLNA